MNKYAKNYYIIKKNKEFAKSLPLDFFYLCNIIQAYFLIFFI